MNCIICNQEIENDSQFINGNWYHNECIENQRKEIERLNNIINEVEKEIERERMEHWAPSPLYLTELLGKIKQLKESVNNE